MTACVASAEDTTALISDSQMTREQEMAQLPGKFKQYQQRKYQTTTAAKLMQWSCPRKPAHLDAL
jgi:hypothetical protein